MVRATGRGMRATACLAGLLLVAGALVTVVAAPPAAADGPPLLYLPYPANEAWKANGPHRFGSGSSIRNSVDFGPVGDRHGTVVAAAAGKVIYKEKCAADGWEVRIRHADNYVTGYYHLSEVEKSLVAGKTEVEAGQAIGKTGTGCPPNTFSHVHFSLYRIDPATRKLTHVSLDGMSIGGYTLHAKAYNYGGWWTRDSDGKRVLEDAPCRSGGAGCANPALPNDQLLPPRGGGANLDVALLIDSSGSMQWNDPDDIRKTGARLFLSSAVDGDHVTVVDFDGNAEVVAPLAELPRGFNDLVRGIDRINSQGLTDIGGGVDAACRELSRSTTGHPKAVVLLTDGQGDYADEHKTSCGSDWAIFTIGLSRDADADLLRRIARETGGTFQFLDDPAQLAPLYVDMRALLAVADPSVAKPLERSVVRVPVGAKTNVGFKVPNGLIQMSSLSFWQGSTVDTALISPSGVVYSCTRVQSNSRCDQGPTFELITVIAPEAGNWTARLFGTKVPAGGEDTTLLVSGIPVPKLRSEVGLVDPGQGRWHLRKRGGNVVRFFFGNPGDVPMTGDWDCDGVDTPGMYRQSDGFVYLRNTNNQGIADIRFFFGNPGDVPLAGDFNGNGCDTVSVYRPSEGRFFIINELGENNGGLGAAETAYYFGDTGDKPFVGDFDGDGVETVGLHRETTGLVYFRNTHTTGIAHSQFIFGDPGDRLIAGDWTGNGSDSPGLFRPADGRFYLRYSNTQGNADDSFPMGATGWLPVAGTFGRGG